MKTKTSRRLSGVLFLISNFYLLIANIHNTNVPQLIAALLFISCSIALILSATRHRFLFWGGGAVAVAYILTASSNESGVFSYLSMIAGVIGGGLIFRAGLQRETGKQYPLPSFLRGLDQFPLAMAGLIEGSSCLFLLITAYIHHDKHLMIASALWVCAHLLLINSDEYLRDKIEHKHTKTPR